MEDIMGNLFPILLIGCLSMLTAEVFAGVSHVWYVELWDVLITLPLYTAHTLFFFRIAWTRKKTSISQLYLFGMIFALYESWITKVLWAGYPDSAGPVLGTFLGIGISELPILVFFWHPIMSFIVPVLIFQVMTGKILDGHSRILRKTAKKTSVIIMFLIIVSTFIVNGNKSDLLLSNLSVIGSIILIVVFYYLSRKTDLEVLLFRKAGFVIITIYMFLLYVASFFLIVPERIPRSIIPYISIIVLYAVPIILIRKSEKEETKLTAQDKNRYNIKDLAIFAAITIIAVNSAVILPDISSVVFVFSYYLLGLAGIVLFVSTVFGSIKPK